MKDFKIDAYFIEPRHINTLETLGTIYKSCRTTIDELPKEEEIPEEINNLYERLRNILGSLNSLRKPNLSTVLTNHIYDRNENDISYDNIENFLKELIVLLEKRLDGLDDDYITDEFIDLMYAVLDIFNATLYPEGSTELSLFLRREVIKDEKNITNRTRLNTFIAEITNSLSEKLLKKYKGERGNIARNIILYLTYLCAIKPEDKDALELILFFATLDIKTFFKIVDVCTRLRDYKLLVYCLERMEDLWEHFFKEGNHYLEISEEKDIIDFIDLFKEKVKDVLGEFYNFRRPNGPKQINEIIERAENLSKKIKERLTEHENKRMPRIYLKHTEPHVL